MHAAPGASQHPALTQIQNGQIELHEAFSDMLTFQSGALCCKAKLAYAAAAPEHARNGSAAETRSQQGSAWIIMDHTYYASSQNSQHFLQC